MFIENVGSQNNPQFASPQINQFGISIPSDYYLRLPSFGDIDADGDFDLLSNEYILNYGGGSYGYHDFYYQNNKGSASNPMFSLEALNPFGLSAVLEDYSFLSNSEMVDLDGDGDQDIISTAMTISDYGEEYEFHYYENNSGASNTLNLSDKFNLYPNPASDIINIASNYNIKLIEVIDQLGRIMLKKENSNNLVINGLSKGIYSFNIYFEDKKITKKFTKL